MADLKETIYRKLFNVALTNIETVKTEDKSLERVKLSVEAALQFLQQPKDYPFKDKLILQLFENISVKSSSSAIIKSENDHIDWYDKNKDRPYWETYREYLKNDKQYSLVDFLLFLKKLYQLHPYQQFLLFYLLNFVIN